MSDGDMLEVPENRPIPQLVSNVFKFGTFTTNAWHQRTNNLFSVKMSIA